MSNRPTKPAWHYAGSLIAALLVLMLLLYRQTGLYLIGLWNQLDIGEYAHGYLVLAISAYLIFDNRKRLAALMPCPEYRVLLIVVAVSMLWLVSVLVDVQMLQTVGLLLLVLALVWTVLGNQVMSVLVFPILFIGFAIPIWFPLSPLLQNLTADVVFASIRLLGVPAFRQDNMIVLPAGTLSIEESCSGLRYLLAALTLGTLYAYMNYSSMRARLIVVLVSAAAAVLANIIRVFIVVYLGYTSEMQHPLVHDHLFLGWYLFGGMVVILLFLDARLHKVQPVVVPDELDARHESNPATCKWTFRMCLMMFAGVGLIVAAAPAVVYQVSQQSAGKTNNVAPELPLVAGNWLQTRTAKDDWMPVYHGAVNQQQVYQRGDDKVILYLGYYAIQKQGEELINELNQISKQDVWHTIYPKARKQLSGNRQVLEQMINSPGKKQKLVWYWYNVANTDTTNRYEAKLLQVLGLLTGKPEAYVVAAAVETGDDVDAARQVLKDFIFAIEKPMQEEMLPD